MQLASFSMAEVTYATGDIAYIVQEQAKSASFKVKARQENVSGVVLPAFDVDRVAGSGTSSDVRATRTFMLNCLARFQPHWTGTRWTTSSTSQRSLR